VHGSESTGVHDSESTGVPDNESTGVPDKIADDATGDQEAAVREEPIKVDTNEEEEDEVEPIVVPYNPNTWTPSIQRVHGLRPRKGREYSHLHATIMHHAITQYSLKKGLKSSKKLVKKRFPKSCYNCICEIHSNLRKPRN
jgi:hypothetical protein